MVIFPSGSHVVGRSGTSFSGATAEWACGHQDPQSSTRVAARHQDRGRRAMLQESVSFCFPPRLKSAEDVEVKGQGHHSPNMHGNTLKVAVKLLL